MPKYQSKKDLPESVRNSLPAGGEDIYRSAFNSAWEQYNEPHQRRAGRNREETAHAVAWSAVKNKYKKVKEGDWVRKSSSDD